MKNYILTIFGIAVLSAISILLIETPSEESLYLENIKSLGITKLDGPEKSAYRDVIMTMDPKTGKVPRKNLHHAIRESKGRVNSARDFKWQQVNSEIAGRTRSLMIDPNDGNKLWAGAVTGGLWFNPDFRNNAAWVPVSDDWESMSIACISHDPLNTNIFYVGTGESFTSVNIYRESSSAGVGIYQSLDGGSTWSLLSSTTDFDYVNDIVVREENGSSVIYAGVASGVYQGGIFDSNPTDGLYRSTDGGQSWTQVLPNIEGSSVPYAVSDIEVTDAGQLYVGSMRNLELKGGGIILQSSDGLNWNINTSFADEIIEIGNDNGLNVLPGRVKLTAQGDMIYAAGTGGWLNSFNQIRDSPNLTQLMYEEGGNWINFDGPTETWASIPWHALAFDIDPANNERIVAGGLDGYALSNAKSAGTLSWARVSDWSSMYYFSDYLIPYYGLQNVDSVKNHFIHADIHDFQFVNGSTDELLSATDGGVYYSSDFSKAFDPLNEERLTEYPLLGHINNSLATTQYYTIALHPDKGNNEILVGSQDNSTHTSETGEITYGSMIGGGDGAYCFFDRDDPSLRITSSQVNNYNFFIDGIGSFFGTNTGSFINPAEYDDRSNLLYTNMAVDGGFEVLIPSLAGRFLDTLAIINVNAYLNKDLLGLPEYSEIRLGTNSTAAFSALKVSPHDDALDASMVLGNQLGDVYFVTGLPFSPQATKIDNDDLPVGYISSVDIGDTNNDILVTLSNYGVESVWYTPNRGGEWINLERNLPDIPVRYGVFNPLDDLKILLATEMGVWGLENILDETEQWKSYNSGFPNVRVDMLKARASDSVVAVATHGRGAFLGKFNQGELIDDPLSINANDAISVYPNPTTDRLFFSQPVSKVDIYSLGGKLLFSPQVENQSISLSHLNRGIYVVKSERSTGKSKTFKIIKQ
ncbi:T9SS type A sorting domain-containing protein [Ekhidna sp.]|uniref:T9SS type A sorting domain-containing protein n=1 Tax=Ekhidna sp. TaxID=2608089 RepID=UPI003B510266